MMLNRLQARLGTSSPGFFYYTPRKDVSTGRCNNARHAAFTLPTEVIHPRTRETYAVQALRWAVGVGVSAAAGGGGARMERAAQSGRDSFSILFLFCYRLVTHAKHYALRMLIH
jgi:hypothetical protein